MRRSIFYRWFGWRRLQEHPARARAKRSFLAGIWRNGWVFGLLLGLIALFVGDLVQDNVDCTVNRYYCVVMYGSASLGLFAAGLVADAFVRSRSDSPVVKALLLTGLAYLLFFPLNSVVITAWMDLDQFFNRRTIFGVGYDILEQLLYHWLGGLGGYNPAYLLGIAICSALYVFVPRLMTKNSSPSEVVLPYRMRRRDIGGGLVLVAFGMMLGLARYAGVLEQIQALKDTAKQWDQPQIAQGVALLQGDLWKIVGWSSLPYIVVGGLLLLPLGRLASHRATG